jgi:2-haloacid dehalogenase
MKLAAFDLYGTLLDVKGLADRLRAFAGDRAPHLLQDWRAAQLQITWDLNGKGEYRPFDQVTANALETVAPDFSPAVREQMCATWLSLPAFPDALESFQRLHKAGIRCAVLSNGTHAMIYAALRAAALPIDLIHSVDEVKVYKPDPRVYALLPREGTVFVSGNGWDAEGAKRFGLQVAWLDRGGPPPKLAPDFRFTSLAELSRALPGQNNVGVGQ